MFGSTVDRKVRWMSALVLLALVLPTFGAAPAASVAQANSRNFPETGKTVKDKFLTYWDTHGGLAQQGFPITEELQEKSDTDGKTYTVQYFERAVFELHPENAAPYDVLLQLLGVFFYKETYPSGAPNQVPNANVDSTVFPETGKRVGGIFLAYWKNNGALAQQGYPISDEFTEVNKLDGKPYKVQYFERAVFEYHPEIQDPKYQVLLSQLGTFRDKVVHGKPTPIPATPTPVAPPPATATPKPTGPDCSGVPAPKDGTITPNCGPIGTVFDITITGFTPNEAISYWLTMPNGIIFGTQEPLDVGNHSGSLRDRFDSSFFDIPGLPVDGVWAMTYEGADSHHQSIVWFKIVPKGGAGPTATPVPPSTCDPAGSRDGSAVPSSVHSGTTVTFTAWGFNPGERVSYWFTDAKGNVAGTPAPLCCAGSDGYVHFQPAPFPSSWAQVPGKWALTVQGESSSHQSVIYFCVTP